MADKYVQLKDNNGNNLYPAVADFPLSILNGGTGGITVYSDSGSVTGSTQHTKSYTVTGNGFIYASISTTSDGTSGSGAVLSQIQKNGTWIANEYNWISSATTAGVSANASTMELFSNGDTLSFLGMGTKAGTKTIKIKIFAFGCTLT